MNDYFNNDEFEKLLKKWVNASNEFVARASGNASTNYPNARTDIYETGAYTIYDVELPGFNKGEINVDLIDHQLIVSATHSSNNERKNYGQLISQERTYPPVKRSFVVDKAIVKQDISAKYDGFNLVISVKHPTPTQPSSSSITIE